MQTLRKKTSPCKYRNDPGRFFGDGVQFKAKLIGILEVGEARGDRMCQEALQDLKMAIRAAGEHKQRITIHVTIDGLRLRDEKTGDSLYHHPVHKISFIAQDMTDSRAFGYIFGSPDSGHRFFGIKTDKAASQVVLAMRDLFQVVFELKKKEIELARQQIQSKSIHHHDQHQLASLSSLKSAATIAGQNDLSGLGGGSSNSAATLSMLNNMASSSTNTPSNNRLGVNLDSKGISKEISPESVADLVDLEQELSSLQRGINQMERITPNDGAASKSSIGGNDDPFGDSFTNFPTLPPPEPGRSRSKTSTKSIDLSTTANAATSSSLLSPSATQTRQSPDSSTGICSMVPPLQPMDDDDNWLRELDAHNDVFDTSKTMMPGLMGMPPLASSLSSSVPLTGTRAPLATRESTATPPNHIYETVSCSAPSAMPDMNELGNVANSTTTNAADANSIANSPSLTDIFQTAAATATGETSSKVEIKSDAFTDLDPLGTGRIRPYVDKKYFFQELKNPPKKVLKDLTANTSVTSSSSSSSLMIATTTPQAANVTVAATAPATAATNIAKSHAYATTATATATTSATATASAIFSMGETQKSYHNNLLQSSVTDEILNLQDFDMRPTTSQLTSAMLLTSSSTINSLLTTVTTTTASASASVTAPSLLTTEPLAASVSGTTASDPVMLPRDTDPFSPTRKKSDPFEEGGDIFSKLDPFEFEFNGTEHSVTEKSRKSTSDSMPSPKLGGDAAPASQDLLAGHLQVSLPPEGGAASGSGFGEVTQTQSTIRSRPVPSSAMASGSASLGGVPAQLPPASLLKQQTVDVISSISNKKMPHLFGQSSRFPKRDSNSINMRRLQESDSLSETETAPEPPPRPDSATYSEPPPLPPKKQFNDIVIRPRAGTSSTAAYSSSRYESVNSGLASKLGATSRTPPMSSGAADVPPIPLPSRRVGRSDGSYPGPGRPRKPGHTEDDYLAPLSGSSASANIGVLHNPDVPPLLPPPTQSSTRTRTNRQQSFHQSSKSHDIYENKNEILQQQKQLQQQQQQKQQQQLHTNPSEAAPLVPDITLSQLLTLGIDELSTKLNVPTSKLSTMTLVELTSYLAEFLEQSKPEPKPKISDQQTIFKVNFDQEATFVAKFDDTFGEDFQQPAASAAFEANFAQFDQVNVEPPAAAQQSSSVPPADRYAVFREIIDQELQQQQESVDLIGDVMEADETQPRQEQQFESNIALSTDLDMAAASQDLLSGDMPEIGTHQPTKIDTKISEVLAQAKDRYAALRDLILVENLFDNPAPQHSEVADISDHGHSESKSPFHGFSGFNDDDEDQDLKQLMDQSVHLDATTQQQRLGLVDSRGFLVEPSSSAITVEDDEEDDERRAGREDKDYQGGASSADSNDKDNDKDNLTIATSTYEQLANSNQQLEEIGEKPDKIEDTPKISITQSLTITNENNYLSTGSVVSSALSGSKDDLEIDDLMQRAISNLSLDSRERNSPAISANLLSTTSGQPQVTNTATTTMTPQHFNDVSTSPIPMPKSPAASITTQAKSPNNSSKSPQQISPLPSHLNVVSQIIDAATRQMQTDTVSKTSNESWATFDTPQHQPPAPPPVSSDKRARPSAKALAKSNNFLNLPPPPGSTSNCSQNDSALESPCSSDPRDEGWHKRAMGGSSLSLGHHSAVGSTSGQRRYHKKERQNTSSSSRDLSWDEDQGVVGSGHMMDYAQGKRVSGPSQGSLTTERLGYYRRHARRMNSCDEDYEYEQDFSSGRSRDPCKHKRNISKSRDNFDMDSPGWYHHHGGPSHPSHHTWSSQEIEQARGRSFDRSAYERTTYGPPIYDKRGVGPPLPPTSSYDRRSVTSGGYEKRNKYYRGDAGVRQPNSEHLYSLDDFDEMLAATGKIPPHLAAMYEEMKSDCCSPQMGGHRQRTSDYMYERDRKSFDRESLESYEGSHAPTRRRRRSYDSGGMPSDPYGSCDSRDEYNRDRCFMTAEKSRSLRKSLKSLRVSGDIDYDQDSEKEYHYREQRARCDTRSLQRPSQLSTQGGAGGIGAINTLGSQSRIRKSSGSSPWDGEEPPMPGQKVSSSSWKRPSSAADAERRLAESRRAAAVKGQTPSGSEDDKDRRYRKKRGLRGKDLTTIPGSAGRYRDAPPPMRSSNYDYIGDLDDDAEDYVDEEEEEEEDRGIGDDEISPADEDKFARLEMRRHEMHNRMMDTHVRRRKDAAPPQSQIMPMAYRKNAPGPYGRKPLPPAESKHHAQDYGYDDDGDYEQTPTPRSNTSSALPTATPNTSTKFSFDVGFESDFNQTSPPPAPAGTASSCNSTPAANVSAANTPASKSSFRFSNDFSSGLEREKQHFQHSAAAGSLQQYDLENRGISPQAAAPTQVSTPKLRFDDNVKVSQFDDAFEDDFSKTSFDAFENDDQWQESLQRTAKQQMRNNKLQQRQQELIKKSESINIFAKKVEDPFEDDDFFNSPGTQTQNSASGDKQDNGGSGGGSSKTSNNGNSFHPPSWDDNNTNFAKFDENM
ncbi:protein disabled isoform X2 [Stomoxys calcitrans]|uniref:protein disabled isoform X2 n=1 Tax=Stomoxys calcitrans TaxID=35570 RepID=UPI0027E21E69|nr:protein disabled isoform X2 [Stomoxys calcitrans]XP_013107325.2 protein disabled isoform X2 [Stomoxys calcitrans]